MGNVSSCLASKDVLYEKKTYNKEEGVRQLRLLIEDPFPYLKGYGPSHIYPFTNTCVSDSVLAALHTTSIIYLNVEVLFKRNDFISEVLSLLNEKKYIAARHHFVEKCYPGKRDLHGNVKDYFPMIDEMVCAQITYKQNPPNDCAVYKEISSILRECGDVIVLGNPSYPTLILVHRDVVNPLYPDCQSMELPYRVVDEKRRTFALQFLLLGKDGHMTMCFQSDENKWHLYDNDPNQPSFQPFDFKNHKTYAICLAGYVNVTQDQEFKFGIPEISIYSDARRSVKVEDPSPCPLAIPETGERLGPKPFHQSQPEFSPKFSNQEQQMKDVEMASCSSSDSDQNSAGYTCYPGIQETGSSSIYSDARRSVKVEDPSPYPLAIPETGERLGPKPFRQSQPEFSPKFSNQEQQMEDVEMKSCRSSDSD